MLSIKQMARENKRDDDSNVIYLPVLRPRTRSKCKMGPRPCPWAGCSHHLYLDVNPESGAIKVNFPHVDVMDMPETCALDVADRGGTTLEEVGAILNLTRERIRQIEVSGLKKLHMSRAAKEYRRYDK